MDIIPDHPATLSDIYANIVAGLIFLGMVVLLVALAIHHYKTNHRMIRYKTGERVRFEWGPAFRYGYIITRPTASSGCYVIADDKGTHYFVDPHAIIGLAKKYRKRN